VNEPALVNAQTRSKIDAPIEERKGWIEQDHWVDTVTTGVAFKSMESLLLSHRRLRPRCLQIIGAPGMGKSTILQAFARLHPVVETDDPLRLQRPVLLVNVTNQGRGISDLREAFMKALWPAAWDAQLASRPSDLDASLRAQGVRLALLDEVGELLKCGPKVHERVLGEIRRISHEHRINLVAAAVEGLSHAFVLDAQLQTRFQRIVTITRWSETQQFRNFLYGYEQYLPFPQRSDLDSQRIVKWLLKHCRSTEDVIASIQDAALYALGDGSSRVRLAHFRKTLQETPPPITLRYCA
jgi:energy-coupling factor transporter ATP-binding protein EcfA2